MAALTVTAPPSPEWAQCADLKDETLVRVAVSGVTTDTHDFGLPIIRAVWESSGLVTPASITWSGTTATLTHTAGGAITGTIHAWVKEHTG